MRKFVIGTALAVGLFAAAGSVWATTIVLDFENINLTYPTLTFATVDDFYNGGTSGAGTSGTNFGVGFSPNALAVCLNISGVLCSNASRGGFGNPDSAKGGLFFVTGSQTFMNVAAGFDTGFSFFYSAINNPSSVSVFDGLSGTGNLLATLNLGLTTFLGCNPSFGAQFCPFEAAGIAFSGIAKSVSFAGAADQVVFDDITFGSIDPGQSNGGTQVPEPGSLLLFAMGLLGLAGIGRRRHLSITQPKA